MEHHGPDSRGVWEGGGACLVWRFAASLPASLKMCGGDGKPLVKTAPGGAVPDSIVDRPKMGSRAALVRWLRNEMRDVPGELLPDSPGSLSHVREAQSHPPGACPMSGRGGGSFLAMWVLVQLEMWHREVVEAPRPDVISARARLR